MIICCAIVDKGKNTFYFTFFRVFSVIIYSFLSTYYTQSIPFLIPSLHNFFLYSTLSADLMSFSILSFLPEPVKEDKILSLEYMIVV